MIAALLITVICAVCFLAVAVNASMDYSGSHFDGWLGLYGFGFVIGLIGIVIKAIQ